MLPDIQDEFDPRGIALHRVGIAGVRYPTRFYDGETEQSGVANFDIAVGLDAHRRGTHMSRMVSVIHETLSEVDPRTLPVTLKAAAIRLGASEVEVQVALPVATQVISPVSEHLSWQTSDLRLRATWRSETCRVESSVTSEVTSLCPCSKAISDYGAHNQRSAVEVTTAGHGDDCYPLAFGRAVELIRQAGSCPIYPLVKRPDERVITMEAFEHPLFVEDMARDLSIRLRTRRLEHTVRVRNFESIHSHDAVAEVQWSPQVERENR
ncbi:GTP cyclohydrolase I FolE2 [Kribbella lupini]|uniref:GTP cyclohydrolase FolE2 n=1 Tax=Kribbella lupini TaxID=291602 RepID=A0ABN2BKU2_9ACTN